MNIEIEIGHYKENSEAIQTYEKMSFVSIDEAIATLNIMKMGYDILKNGHGLVVRLDQNHPPHLLDSDSVVPIINLRKELLQAFSTTSYKEESINTNFGFLIDDNTQYAKSTTGVDLPFKIYSADNTEAKNNLLSNLEESSTDFAYVERQFSESKVFDFNGTEKIQSYNDVAWLFSALEDTSIEHAFLVYNFNDKGYFVQHVSSGTFDSAIVDTRPIIGNVVAANPSSITLVHNHPTGRLVASKADFDVLGKLKKALEHTSIKVDGVIINIRSGKYLVFDADLNERIALKEQLHDPLTSIKSYSFDKQIFARDYNPISLMGPDDVARYISTQKLGVSDRTEMLVMNNANYVLAKFLLPKEGDQTNFILNKISQFGGISCILYGNNITPEEIQRYKDRLEPSKLRILDGLLFKSENAPIIYKSFFNDGLLNDPVLSYPNQRTAEPHSLYNMENNTREELQKLIPEERKGDAFDIKVSKAEAEHLLMHSLIDDVMCKEYGPDEDWVGMTQGDFDEETNMFDEDYQTFEIDIIGYTKTNLERLINEIEKYQQVQIPDVRFADRYAEEMNATSSGFSLDDVIDVDYSEFKKQDLFETIEQLPVELQQVIKHYQESTIQNGADYVDSQNFLKEVEKLGYTFEFGLDAEPFNLQQMEDSLQYDSSKVIIELSEKQKSILLTEGLINLADKVHGDEFYASLSLLENNTVSITWANGEENNYPLQQIIGEVQKHQPEQIINNQNFNTMENLQQIDYVKTNLKYLGFGESEKLHKDVEAGINSPDKQFEIKTTSDKTMPGNSIDFTLKFNKSEQGGVFLNSFDASLTNTKGETLTQNFPVNKNQSFTVKEAINLMEGRNVKNEFVNPKTNEQEAAFVKLNFKDGKNEYGNYNFDTYYKNYGVDVNKIVEKSNLIFDKPEYKDHAIANLEKGNIVKVKFELDNKVVEGKAVLNAQYKNLSLYDNEMNRINTNKPIEGLENEQKNEKGNVREHSASRGI